MLNRTQNLKVDCPPKRFTTVSQRIKELELNADLTSVRYHHELSQLREEVSTAFQTKGDLCIKTVLSHK